MAIGACSSFDVKLERVLLEKTHASFPQSQLIKMKFPFLTVKIYAFGKGSLDLIAILTNQHIL